MKANIRSYYETNKKYQILIKLPELHLLILFVKGQGECKGLQAYKDLSRALK